MHVTLAGHLPCTVRCIFHPQLPRRPWEWHLNPHPWSLWVHEDSQVMVPVSAGLCGLGVPRHGAVMGMMKATLSGELQLHGCHPRCPCPNPVHEESCLKPASSLPGLTGLCFGSRKSITSLLHGRMLSTQEWSLSSRQCPPQPRSKMQGIT